MFDAFGKPRATDGNTLTPPRLQNLTLSRNGFTDHRHLDEVELIHMNGRAYDYNLGRFLSVDPVIQSPGNSQSLNPYSYIMNNPLAGTDPTGYAAEIIICQNGKSVVDCGGAPSNQDSSGKSGSGGSGPDGRPRENTGPGNGATSTRQIPNQATTDIGSQLNTTNVASSGRNGQQGASTSEAISFMWNSFWDHRGEVVSGAVAGAADVITQNSGGWIDGGTLTDLTGINAASEALIAGSYGEWAGMSAATVAVIAGRFKTVGHTLENIAGSGRKFWANSKMFNGNKVFQRNDLINPKLTDSRTGLTNVELMRSGRAPIGPDGKPINLHHMTQRHEGAIAEVSQTFHQRNSNIIHINPSTTQSGINRADFNKWRSEYWKSRANDF
ncbi:RHS repeat-associated protein [Rheinheimera pacifica]|uniref:HNH/ENDO VII family nuclease n=1 Tax=Rheinheimera pacifica TaxID=173990 RepID=UPI002168447C|nr:HNH/ENDO VII family nuclease [Rheinheimera pacifica]MCS4308604.1 RHS repeat-associated protein [Rheinheimera pacifica]